MRMIWINFRIYLIELWRLNCLIVIYFLIINFVIIFFIIFWGYIIFGIYMNVCNYMCKFFGVGRIEELLKLWFVIGI